LLNLVVRRETARLLKVNASPLYLHRNNPECPFNPLNAELNPICCLLALLGAHHFLHVSRVKVNNRLVGPPRPVCTLCRTEKPPDPAENRSTILRPSSRQARQYTVLTIPALCRTCKVKDCGVKATNEVCSICRPIRAKERQGPSFRLPLQPTSTLNGGKNEGTFRYIG
jgi:hypothetical protein